MPKDMVARRRLDIHAEFDRSWGSGTTGRFVASEPRHAHIARGRRLNFLLSRQSTRDAQIVGNLAVWAFTAMWIGSAINDSQLRAGDSRDHPMPRNL